MGRVHFPTDEFVKRKGTKAAKKLPDDFAQVKLRFMSRVCEKVKAHQIPPELVLNLDETGLPIVPVSNWTLDVKGAPQVALIGL